MNPSTQHDINELLAPRLVTAVIHEEETICVMGESQPSYTNTVCGTCYSWAPHGLDRGGKRIITVTSKLRGHNFTCWEKVEDTPEAIADLIYEIIKDIEYTTQLVKPL